jgi:hypothetical protein
VILAHCADMRLSSDFFQRHNRRRNRSPHSAAPRFPLVAPGPPGCSRSLSRSCFRPAPERIDMAIFNLAHDGRSWFGLRSTQSASRLHSSILLYFGDFKPSGFKVPFLRKRLLCSGNVNCCRNTASPSLTRIRGLAFLFVLIHIYFAFFLPAVLL